MNKYSKRTEKLLSALTTSILIFMLNGCASLPKSNCSSSNNLENASSFSDSKNLCSGHLQMSIPANWEMEILNGVLSGRGPNGELVELKVLRRPGAAGSARTYTSAETLSEFMALKAATMNKIHYEKLWPYSLFAMSAKFQSASAAIAYSGDDNGYDYSIQYLVAEPDIIYMFTIDKHGIEVDGVESDKRKFDEIVRTAKWNKEWIEKFPMECRN